MIEVVCALIFESNRILVCQRPFDKHEGGKWEFPGGKVEPEETPQGALRREIKEELGVSVQVGKEMTPAELGKIKLMPYRCELQEEDLVLNEHLAMKWITAEEIPFLDWAAADIPISQQVARLIRVG